MSSPNRERWFLNDEKNFLLYLENTDIHMVHKQIYSVSVILKFHEGEIRENCLKGLLGVGGS